MSNIIQIKRGIAAPGENNLAPYELGYVVNRYAKTEVGNSDTIEIANGGYLYIGDLKKGDSSITIPVKIKAGYADEAGIANGLSAEAKAELNSIKVDNATNADYATEARSAEQAQQAQYAESAGSANTAKEATYAYDADTAVYAETAGQAIDATNADNFKINSQYVNYETLKSTLLKEIYPIGSIYMSVNSTSPANLFGGTWERLQDRFLVGIGSTFNEPGGSTTHSHALSDNAYAKINHHGGNFYFEEVEVEAYKTSGRGNSYGEFYDSFSETSAIPLSGATDSASNLPPYLPVYMWKRTA